MLANILAQHVALIRDYPGAPPAPPPPPPPPPSPQPPDDAIAFTAQVIPSLYGVVGTPISSTTMATVTCSDTGMTLRVEPAVPGLTWSYSAGSLTVSGTPTTQGQWRVTVNFIASDGSNVIRGATAHLVTIEDFSIPFTVGTCLNPVVKIGETVDLTLCSPTTAKNVDVFASPNATIPVETTGNPVNGLVFTWTPGATSSGTLKLQGTIASTAVVGTTTLTVTYKRKGQQQTVYATSVHTVTVEPRYVEPPSPPPPSPPPPTPTPAPPPPVPPAPSPGFGPDPYFSFVKVLMHFDTATGIATDVKGNTFTNHGATLTDGVVEQGALFTSADTYIEGTVSGIDGATGSIVGELAAKLTAECMAELLDLAGLARFGFAPVLTCMSNTGTPLWTLGYLSRFTPNGGRNKLVAPYFCTFGPEIQNRTPFALYRATDGYPATDDTYTSFTHLSFMRRPTPATPTTFREDAVWADFAHRGRITQAEADKLPVSATCKLRIGGSIPGAGPLIAPNVTIIPFGGVTDELRITTTSRWSGVFTGDQNTPVLVATPDPTNYVKPRFPWPNF